MRFLPFFLASFVLLAGNSWCQNQSSPSKSPVKLHAEHVESLVVVSQVSEKSSSPSSFDSLSNPSTQQPASPSPSTSPHNSVLSDTVAPFDSSIDPISATTNPKDTVVTKTNEIAPTPTLLGQFNQKMAAFLFFDVSFGLIKNQKVDTNNQPILQDGIPVEEKVAIPLIVVVLLFGGIFFTFWFRWINLRGFYHAWQIVTGKFAKIEDRGEISHFRALTSALSATVGLGNIAGVAIAIQMGGPGATFWLIVAAIFGMSLKFTESTLAQMYRKINPDGSVSGGPMYYLDLGFKELGRKKLGKVLAVSFAFMTMMGAIGGGNMFQVNQTVASIQYYFKLPESSNLIIGIVMCIFVAAVILGGIKRIGSATSRLVPFMVFLYVGASLYIILSHVSELPAAMALIVKMAFTDNAMYGGFIGVLVIGVRRASFSNEAGLGSSAIAHSAAKTEEPVREGLVAMLEPFIDTIIVCFMTAMVVIVTGAWNDPANVGKPGVGLTMSAFGSVISWYPAILTGCIVLFAYSTIISWCYYGERGWIYLLDHFNGMGNKTVFVFRIFFLLFVLVGAVESLENVIEFTDLMILSMAYPNILGSLFLASKLKVVVNDYWTRYQAGAFAVQEKLNSKKAQVDFE